MTTPPRDLRIYLDLAEEDGRTTAAIVVEDDRGEELVARRQTLSARDSRSPRSLLLQFFAGLEESLVHGGTRLRVVLCSQFRGVDLGVPVLSPGDTQTADPPGDVNSDIACDQVRERIRELSEAFEHMTILVTDDGHESHATALLKSSADR